MQTVTGRMRTALNQEYVVKGVVRYAADFGLAPEIEVIGINHAISQLDRLTVDEAIIVGCEVLKILLSLSTGKDRQTRTGIRPLTATGAGARGVV